jgi:hypothetical protein
VSNHKMPYACNAFMSWTSPRTSKTACATEQIYWTQEMPFGIITTTVSSTVVVSPVTIIQSEALRFRRLRVSITGTVSHEPTHISAILRPTGRGNSTRIPDIDPRIADFHRAQGWISAKQANCVRISAHKAGLDVPPSLVICDSQPAVQPPQRQESAYDHDEDGPFPEHDVTIVRSGVKMWVDVDDKLAVSNGIVTGKSD